MPRADRGALAHSGCRVSGVALLANGQLLVGHLYIEPGHGGVWHGVAYSPQRIAVQTDSEGRWDVVLPPSSVMGRYTVEIDKHRFTFTVPEAGTANFVELLE